jgi:hypothetical protein
VLQGNAVKAKKMYQANPGLLFIEAAAEDYAAGIDENLNAVHRTIVASPFRAAAGAGDVSMLYDMAGCLDQFVDIKSGIKGHQIANEQLDQQFPNGFDYPPSTYDFSELEAAITLIRFASTTGAYAKFGKVFMPVDVSVGYHFNLNHLIKACEVYEKNTNCGELLFPRAPLWNSNQASIFWCFVIGYLERLVTAVDAQGFSCGFGKYGKPNKREFKLNDDVKKISYFPLAAYPADRLGINFGVDCAIFCNCSFYSGGVPRSSVEYASRLKEASEILCRKKVSGLAKFKQHLKNPHPDQDVFFWLRK